MVDRTADPKDPDATVDYSYDWTELYDEDIVSHQVIVEDGITLVTSQLINGIVYYRLSGGIDGQTYNVTVRITTDSGQIDDRTVAHPIAER